MNSGFIGRILILANEIYPQVCVGGLGKFIAGMAKELSKRGWEVAVFLPEKENKEPVYFPYNSPLCRKTSQKLAEKAWFWCQKNSWRPDFLWVQDIEGAYQARIWRKFRMSKIIWTIHSPLFLGRGKSAGYDEGYAPEEKQPTSWSNEFFDFSGLVKQGVEAADFVFTVSPSFASELTGLPYFAKKSPLGIGNGVDGEEWNPKEDKFLGFKFRKNWKEFKEINKTIAQDFFGLPREKAPVFAFVSRLVPQKGLDLLIRALPKFLAVNNIQLLVVGQGKKKYEKFFENLRRAFPQKTGLCLKADFTLPHQVFAAADFLILPSLIEPFGIVVGEARRYGAVAIVRETGGLKDQVKNGVSGLCFRENKPELLAEKLYQASRLYQTPWWWKVSFSQRNAVPGWQKTAEEYEKYLLADKKRCSSFRRPAQALF